MMNLNTNRLIIRRFKLVDQHDLFELLSDRKTCYDSGGYEPFETMDEEYSCLMTQFLEDEHRYVIELIQEQKVIGSIHLMEEERAVTCYEIGYSIAPNYRRLGYASEAINGLLDYCFNQIEVKIITASVFEGNEKSMKMLEQLGFMYEGMTHKAMNHCRDGVVNLLNYYIEA